MSDILSAITLVEEFTKGTSSFGSFTSDIKTMSAVERQLGIIGEAMNKFRQCHPEIQLKEAGKIIGFRNRLIHAYDKVDSAIVWSIVNRNLAHLKSEISALL